MKDKKNLTTLGNSPAAMIRMAVEGKADLDKLEKLLNLQERFEANEARKAYHAAMAEFKANPPKIGKDKKVSFATSVGKTSYNHASLYNVVEKISVELSKHGLSASWSTKQNGAIMVTCKITHIKGHSEETTLSASADNSGSKNAIQAIGSTITYLERYTLLALTGLATYEMDDDGQAAGKPEVQRPVALSMQKPLEKIRTDFAKAQKLLGNKKFLDILGNEGFESAEQVIDVATATKILKIMEKAYKNDKT